MGAEQFDIVVSGATAEEAFNAAVKQAQYDYGHAGYTGTIAEKQSFVIVGKVPTLHEAEAMAADLLRNGDARIDDKWGPAGCIEITEPHAGKKMWAFIGWASA